MNRYRLTSHAFKKQPLLIDNIFEGDVYNLVAFQLGWPQRIKAKKLCEEESFQHCILCDSLDHVNVRYDAGVRMVDGFYAFHPQVIHDNYQKTKL